MSETWITAGEKVQQLQAELAEAVLRAERYREALEEVLDGWARDRSGCPVPAEEYFLRRDMGRNALA